MFSGQGAQKPGMGKEVYESSVHAKAIFDAAGEDIKNMCFNGTQEDLNQTINTQPCLWTVEIAEYEAFINSDEGKSATIDAVCGFSLGEYAALYAAGVVSFEDGLKIIRRRAELMQKYQRGGMVAILGVDKNKIYDIIEDVKAKCDDGMVLIPVNFNCPGQVVVAGDDIAIDKLCDELTLQGTKFSRLAVSGAFHSPIMQPVVAQMLELFDTIEFKTPKVSIYSNKTAREYPSDMAEFKKILAEQAASAVLWEDTLNNLFDKGYTEFKEIGVGKTLMSFLKRTMKAKDN
jgi:[acyl-carrier-protein] S-malonyltransferase